MHDWQLRDSETLTMEEWAKITLKFVRPGGTEPAHVRPGTTIEDLDEEIALVRQRILYLIADDLNRLAELSAARPLCRSDSTERGG